jgi:tRNA 2-thiocytidine biosynthesis protein TtcA
MDPALFDFRGLRPTGVADAAGDVAFDDPGCATPANGTIRFDRDDE